MTVPASLKTTEFPFALTSEISPGEWMSIRVRFPSASNVSSWKMAPRRSWYSMGNGQKPSNSTRLTRHRLRGARTFVDADAGWPTATTQRIADSDEDTTTVDGSLPSRASGGRATSIRGRVDALSHNSTLGGTDRANTLARNGTWPVSRMKHTGHARSNQSDDTQSGPKRVG